MSEASEDNRRIFEATDFEQLIAYAVLRGIACGAMFVPGGKLNPTGSLALFGDPPDVPGTYFPIGIYGEIERNKISLMVAGNRYVVEVRKTDERGLPGTGEGVDLPDLMRLLDVDQV